MSRTISDLNDQNEKEEPQTIEKASRPTPRPVGPGRGMPKRPPFVRPPLGPKPRPRTGGKKK